MKKILFAILAIFCLHMPGFSGQIRVGNSGEEVPLAGQMPEESAPEILNPVESSVSPDASELQSASLLAATADDPAKYNFVKTTVYNSYNAGVGYRQYQYFDGIGNAVETVYSQYTPLKKDLVMYKEYVPGLQLTRSFLPLPSSQTNGTFVPISDYRNLSGTYYGDSFTYSRHYTNHLGRTARQCKAGSAMATPTTFCMYEYTLNTSDDEVRQIVLKSQNGNLVMDASGFYPERTLRVTKITNEDGKISKTYTDKGGRIVLSAAGNSKTYYVYDALGRLTIVITPEGSRAFVSFLSARSSETPGEAVPAALGDGSDAESSQMLRSASVTDPANIGMNDAFVKENCYYYRYDDRGNQISRRFPGGALEEMEYNAKGQLVTRFRGKTKTVNKFGDRYAYDELGRILSVKQVTYYLENGVWKPSLEPPMLLAQYQYDNYGDVPYELSYRIFADFSDAVVDPWRTSGMKTYEKVRILSDEERASGYVERVFYYDEMGRLLQTVEKNHLGGISYFTNMYDFSGNVVFREERVQPDSSTGQDILTTKYTYDQAGRLLTETSSLNKSTPVVLKYSYNEAGQLVGKNVNNLAGPSETYEYNTQGWLTKQTSGCYSAELRYYNPQFSTTPSLTGNITEWSWKISPTGSMKTYSFSYGAQSRMTGAEYYLNGVLNNSDTEKKINYDFNGNITSMTRYQSGTPETLSYTYANGWLNKINGLSFAHDNCGNMITDGRNGLDIVYNYINLPSQIKSVSSGEVINYTYLADGRKFSALDANKTGLIYIGSLVYNMTRGTSVKLESAAFSGGRFQANTATGGASCKPQYYVTDHLGSVRSICDEKGEMIASNQYYPFGKKWGEAATAISSSRNRYNGKEQQWVGASANILDYGARFYNADIARWISQDPLAEQVYAVHPYAYCVNNPIKFIDPYGLSHYRYDFKTGQVILVEDNDDPYDTLGTYEWDAEAKTWVKTKTGGGGSGSSDIKVAKGILRDGMDLKYKDNVVTLGGEHNLSLEQVEKFIIDFSNMIDKEVCGYYMSLGGQPDTSQVFIGRTYANTPVNGQYFVLPDNSNPYVNFTTAYHTHLTRMDPMSPTNRFLPSTEDRAAKVYHQGYGVKNFIILTQDFMLRSMPY